MDANDVKKKFFDVTPPSTSPAKVSPKKRQVIVNEPNEESNDTILPTTEFEEAKPPEAAKVEVKREKIVQPPESDDKSEEAKEKTEPTPETLTVASPVVETEEVNSQIEPEVEKTPEDVPLKEELGVNPLPTVEPEQEAPTITNPEPEDVDTPITTTYSATDSLPEDTTTDATKTETQEPKIYDTTAYHIPIKETTHGHGTKSAFIFGTVFALVFVGGLVYVLAVVAK